MPQIAYRANLSAAVYPMTIADGGRTVIMPGPDQNFDRRVDPTGEQKDAGIPQALYLENVMPTASGYQSVGYRLFTSDMITGGNPVAKAIEVVASDSLNLYKNYIYLTSPLTVRAGNQGRSLVTSDSGVPAFWTDAAVFSSAAVRGVAYLYVSSTFKELHIVTGTSDSISLTIVPGVLPGGFMTSANIKQILSFANYLIAISSTGKVYWSSTTTPTDFTASLVSGAGSIELADLRGIFVTAAVCSKGFYIYTTENAIFGQYTGNSRYPFKFNVVQNFSGIKLLPANYTQKTVAGSPSFKGNVVIDQFGSIKLLDGLESTNLDPIICSHLSQSSVFDKFNYSTNTFTQTASNTLTSQVFVWQDRYVLISVYGPESSITSQYSHVIVYDFLLQRVGKLKVAHKHVVDFSDYATYRGPGVGFVDAIAGKIRYLEFDIYGQNIPFTTVEAFTGVLLLGKFQYVRSRKIQLHEVQIEGPQNTAITATPNFSCVLLPSLNGRSFDTPITLTARSLDNGLAIYPAHATAQNHSIVLKGAFNVNTLQLRFSPRGDV